MPVSIGIQWDTMEAARSCRRGDIALAFCTSCGFIWNRRFDPARLEYSQRYDNSLDFSPTFQEYARRLARRLIEAYEIRGKDVVELGCGKGHFLALLCEEGNNRGVGFDPSYEGARVQNSASDRITYHQDFYGEKYTGHRGDLICCRHVFEHIPDPAGFLSMVRRTIADRTSAVVYFEVPNVRFILERESVWDIIYEHCNYFGWESFESAFRREGFEVLGIEEAYDGQFLGLEARLAAPSAPAPGPVSRDLSAPAGLVQRFAELVTERNRAWEARLEGYRTTGKRLVVWGAGAKAVTFLNMLRISDQAAYAVDINPHKQGLHLPGTGQRIVPPEFLGEYKPDIVILMNPIYRLEVEATLRQMGIPALIVEA
jgi:SAM-dependent methyltransferase